MAAGNLNATDNKANGVTIAGTDGSVFPTSVTDYTLVAFERLNAATT